MTISPFAGKSATAEQLIDIPKLISAYYTEIPDATHREEQVSFGTSGHRGSSFNRAFCEWHIFAICQAICEFRLKEKITGPLFLGMDTHALSWPALMSALEVFAANDVVVMLAEKDEYTPTPVISHAILTYNRKKSIARADGIVITPSHNPPSEGGIKYNPPNGGPADTAITSFIEKRANEFLLNKLQGVKRLPYEKAIQATTTKRYNYIESYVNDLENVLDMKAISASQISLGVDPLGGAGVHYWRLIKEKYNLNLTVVSDVVDPTFRFMTVDWDGQIRMDPSSPYAMQRLIQLKERFEVAFACDTDHDRHGIVTRSSGLLPTNHYLSVCLFYLFQNRPRWNTNAGVGKTIVTSQMLDRIALKLSRKVFEVPVGFKWFVDGLTDGSLVFVGEESAGGTFARLDGSVWTTDKDGIILALLAAEITAKMGQDPGKIYEELTRQFGTPFFDRIDAKATKDQKTVLKNLSANDIHTTELASEKIESIITKAPADDAPIGGVKVTSKNGWFAARPSGTEDIYKIYAESFLGKEHLEVIVQEAQGIVNEALRIRK